MLRDFFYLVDPVKTVCCEMLGKIAAVTADWDQDGMEGEEREDGIFLLDSACALETSNRSENECGLCSMLIIKSISNSCC